MHSLEAIEFYALHSPRWFESIEQYSPSGEYLDEISRCLPPSWGVRRSHAWYHVSPPNHSLPDQGWKLHVSSSTMDSVHALQRALPVLCAQPVSFKVLLDPRVTSWVNGKLWPRGASGKFITVYPGSIDEFHQIGHALSRALAGFTGPYILSDRRWPESTSVYYRYGAFSSQSVLRPDGKKTNFITSPAGERVSDLRVPWWSPPAWAQDPFSAAREPSDQQALLADRFEVTSPLSFSNRGGIYKAIDAHSGQAVILKEARPHVEVGGRARHATELLEKEHRLLERLADTGSFVRPVAFFRCWEHAFLAEEFVEGDHFGKFTILNNPLYDNGVLVEGMASYLEQARGFWLQIAHAIAAAHQRGITLGDLSFTNILICTETQTIKICDLEAATEAGIDPEVGLFTPGMAVAGLSGRANDYHALGALMFGSLMLAQGMSDLYPPSRTRFLAELRDDLGLSASLLELVEQLMGQPERYVASPRLAAASIEALAFSRRRSSGRLGMPLSQRFGPSRISKLRGEVSAAVAGITSYLRGTADTSRRDRLCPADLAVFETNPLSVAYGATGVLHALHGICNDAPAPLVDWVLDHDISNDNYPPGLYLGQAGVAWVLAELGHLERAAALLRQASKHVVLFQSLDLLHGAAGFGLACLELWRRGGGDDLLTDAIRVGDHLSSTCIRDQRGVWWPDEDGVVKLGYAQGGSGIAMFLLCLSLATDNPAMLQLGRDALDFELASGAWEDGKFMGFPSRVELSDEGSKRPGVVSCYWYMGSAGVGSTLVRYLDVTNDPALHDWMLVLAADASRKYTVFPQLFRGLAGLGNFLLDVWDRTRDDKHLFAAWHVAEGILLFRIDCDEGLAFPGEQTRRESADFATGAAGVGLFLHRLLGVEHGGRPNFNFVIDELLPSKQV